MPIIGSLDGTFGHGRGPQDLPPPGFRFFPRIGSRSNWAFSANGAFVFDGNITYSVDTSALIPNVALGNCYVITPTVNYIANVKIWGAGGGTGGNVSSGQAGVTHGGAGGAVYGQILFQGGQEYTVFAGAGGWSNSSRTSNVRPGIGGAASGILIGNAFATSAETLTPLIIAGGGGGATRLIDSSYRIPGAGGGNLTSQLGEWAVDNVTSYSSTTLGRPTGVTKSGQAIPESTIYSGSITTNGSTLGSGGGGHRGGPEESGGQGYIDPELELMNSETGFYSLASLYDDSRRGTAGDSAKPGRVIIFTDDEYRVTNISAVGGITSEVPIPGYELSYKYHTFTSNGKFTIESVGEKDTIDVFAVGGGGGTAGIAGAGGGAVAIRTDLPAFAANYIVTVGEGGLGSDNYAGLGIGRIFGGYRGGDSAFFNNSLSNRGFPDNYVRLIYSFGAQIRYISGSGDNTNGLTIATAYTTFSNARNATDSIPELIVFVVLQGTYSETIPNNQIQTIINDGGKPRIFVCAPSRVTINFTPQSTQGSQRDSPMAVLEHPQSAVYGATIIRNMFTTTDATELAFFNNRADPGDYQIAGSFYNCVFRENQGLWAFVYGPSTRPGVKFRIENCVFFTREANQILSSIGNSSESGVLVKNCAFNRTITTNAVLENSATGVTIGSKYVIAGVSDKGVYAGEYGWSGVITAPERNVPLTMIVARGGGGAPSYRVDGDSSSELFGGTSPGNVGNGDRIAHLQPTHQANVSYSSYGYPGGRGSGTQPSGGGGAGLPGFDSAGNNTLGGIGVEWPKDSNIYYGTGGSAADALDVSKLVPGTVGKGAGGSVPSAGNSGIVMVRYVVPGIYTEPQPSENLPFKHLIASGGGNIKTTDNYREHYFGSSGVFRILRGPRGEELSYIDVIIIGGGGGGSANYYYTTFFGVRTYRPGYVIGGQGGQVIYRRIPISEKNQLIDITVGSGGNGGSGNGPNSGINGGVSSIRIDRVPSTAVSVSGGQGGQHVFTSSTSISPPQPQNGILITDGLFSDNTVYYGAEGGRQNQNNGGLGFQNPGSGGNGARMEDRTTESGYLGRSGAVIIRYPIFPYS